MYGALGKNNNQEPSKTNNTSFDFWSRGRIITKLVNAQGIKASNKFQFKNRKTFVSVYINRNSEAPKQKRVSAARKTVSFSRLVSFSAFSIGLGFGEGWVAHEHQALIFQAQLICIGSQTCVRFLGLQTCTLGFCQPIF